MSKKLKITEEQLKRLMVLKEQHEGEVGKMEEQSENVDSVDVAGEAERMTDSFVSQFKDLVGDNQELVDKLMVDLSNKLSTNGNEESLTNGEEPNEVVEFEINESIVKIKSEFNRFL